MTVTPLFKPAAKAGRWARVLIPGAYPTWKTLIALRMATGFGGRIGLIDTAGGVADQYASQFNFDMMRMDRFNPADLTRLLYQIPDQGIETLIIDSASPFWSGPGGVMDQVDAIAKANGPKVDKSFAWNDVTPIHRDMLTAISEFPGTLIATVDQKPDLNGTMRTDQREGFEGPFALVLRLLEQGSHTAQVMKTTMPWLIGETIHEPGEDLAVELVKHLAEGATTPPVNQVQVRDWALDPGRTTVELKARLVELEAADQDGARVLLEGKEVVTISEVLRRCISRAGAADTAVWATDPARTVEELAAMLTRLREAHLDHVMVDVGGQQATIGDLIRQRNFALKDAAADQAPAAPVGRAA